MRIGVFGGSFDPPHRAHLEVARASRGQLALDELIFVPAGRNPLKRTLGAASPRHRLRMVQLMIENEPGMSVSDIEIARGGASYTVDTMRDFQQIRPADYWFVLGSDALDSIQQWKQPEKLFKLCRLAVVLRPPHDRGSALKNVPDTMLPFIDFVELPPSAISSTLIRDHLLRGLSVDAYLAPAVAAYARANHLYEKS